MMKTIFNVLGISLCLSVVLGGVFLPYQSIHAAEKSKKIATKKIDTPKSIIALENVWETVLYENTITNGFTAETPNSEFRVGITAGVVSKKKAPIKVTLTRLPRKLVELQDEVILGAIYSYELSHKKGVTLRNPLWVTLQWRQQTDRAYVLKSWDEVNKVWVEIPATINQAEQRLQASLSATSAVLGIFEKEVAYEGVASWYDWHGAAMNELPIGTTVEVTNAATGATATTKIVSTGPYAPGRLIDLPRDIFAAIGNIWDGLINVIVTPLS